MLGCSRASFFFLVSRAEYHRRGGVPIVKIEGEVEFNVKVKSSRALFCVFFREGFVTLLCVFRYAFIKIRFPFRLLILYGAKDFRSATQQAAFSILASSQRAVQIAAGSASTVDHDPQRAQRK